MHRHRFRAVVAGIALLTGVVGAAPPDVLALQYHYDCTSYNLSHVAVVRGADLGFSGTDLTGAIGDAVVRNVLPCSDPLPTHDDEPFVLPANLQSSGNGGIVQVGWVKCGDVPGGTCGLNIPADGNLHFVYICNDLSGGQPCLADGWAGTPILGRRYRFRVQYNQTGTGKWNYSIKDLVTGVTKSTTITSNWHNADGAWYGAETHDVGSTMGPQDVYGDIDMYYMQYLRTSIGQWTVVTDIDNGIDLIRSSSPPSWYKTTIGSYVYTDDQVDWYTVAH